MRIGFLVNEFDTLVASQSTAMFMHEATLLEHDVFVFGVGDLSVDSEGNYLALARKTSACDVVQAQVDGLKQAPADIVDLQSLDRVLIRTNPARDARVWAHETALILLSGLADRGVPVFNSPSGLAHTGSKLFLSELPAFTLPRTEITANRERLEAFVNQAPGATVLKPVKGTRGTDVFKLTPDTPNLKVILEVLLRQGMVVAQDFVPEAVNGDTRVVVMDGRVLEVDGERLAIHRVPRGSDFRSNIHAGGTAEPGVVTEGMLKVVDAVAPILAKHGIRLAGLDFLGELICEINVYSTGGYRDAERFFGRNFSRATLERFLTDSSSAS